MATLEFWYDFASPYAYLAASRIEALAAGRSVTLAWRPFLLGPIFKRRADNASAGLYVLGDEPVSLGAFQLAAVAAVLTCNGKVVSQGQGSACLGHPLRAAYWLACKMARRGERMCAGEIILSGALGPTAPVKSGDLIEADFGEFGRVACRFA